MIKRERLLSLGYYAKAASFTGSDGNKCYKVEKVVDEESGEKSLKATVWPGPFSSENTPEEKKQSSLADFSEEGIVSLCEWMNSIDITED